MRARIGVLVVALVAAWSLTPSRAIPGGGPLDIALGWSPGKPPAGVTTTFTATAADGDGTVTFAQLCYGDGSCSPADTPPNTAQTFLVACLFGDNYTHQWTHAFAHTGSYSVRLTVTTRGCPGIPDETKALSLSLNSP